MTDEPEDHGFGLPMPPEHHPDWTLIDHKNWRAISYDDAMQRGLDELRRSYRFLEQGEGDRGELEGQHHALRAAAWFALARELREVNNLPPT